MNVCKFLIKTKEEKKTVTQKVVIASVPEFAVSLGPCSVTVTLAWATPASFLPTHT